MGREREPPDLTEGRLPAEERGWERVLVRPREACGVLDREPERLRATDGREERDGALRAVLPWGALRVRTLGRLVRPSPREVEARTERRGTAPTLPVRPVCGLARSTPGLVRSRMPRSTRDPLPLTGVARGLRPVRMTSVGRRRGVRATAPDRDGRLEARGTAVVRPDLLVADRGTAARWRTELPRTEAGRADEAAVITERRRVGSSLKAVPGKRGEVLPPATRTPLERNRPDPMKTRPGKNAVGPYAK